MQNIITLDIETIPTQREDVKEYIASGVTHPGNISKAETIAKWNEESRPAAVEEAIGKTGLDGAFGQVVCIGVAFGDAEPMVFCGPDEAAILQDFNLALEAHVTPNHTLQACIVGHNVSAFDLRFLIQRGIVTKTKPHPIIARSAQAKPWESEKVFDTMVQWAGVGGRISLDKLCKALGIKTPKGDITGATVWDAIQAGRIDEVAAYCAGDVDATRQVHLRMTYQADPVAKLKAA